MDLLGHRWAVLGVLTEIRGMLVFVRLFVKDVKKGEEKRIVRRQEGKRVSCPV